MTAHIHAELMMQYAEDAMTTDKPWELWEFRSENGRPWETFGCHPAWLPDYQYRRKPRTINIIGHEVPEPMRKAPPQGTHVWIANLDSDELAYELVWNPGNQIHQRWLTIGVCHSTPEAAKQHTKALLSFTTTEYQS